MTNLHRSSLTSDWGLVSVHSLATPGSEAVVLDEQDVFIAVIPASQLVPTTGDWLVAEWVGDVETTRTARAMIVPQATGTYTVWCKVDGNGWIIVEPAYTLTVT